MELECKHCKYKWNYKGKEEYYATCPKCRYKVKINKSIGGENGKPKPVEPRGETGKEPEQRRQTSSGVRKLFGLNPKGRRDRTFV